MTWPERRDMKVVHRKFLMVMGVLLALLTVAFVWQLVVHLDGVEGQADEGSPPTIEDAE